MTRHARWATTIIKCSLLLSIFCYAQEQNTQKSLSPSLPAGPQDFALVTAATGVELWRKDYQGGYPDFVQIVNLQRGASIKLLHGRISNHGRNQGPYGGDNPDILRESLETAWSNFYASYPNAFSITNGQFFSTNEDPTKLAFPLKRDGRIVSDGYGIAEFPSQKLMLEIWDDRADIVTFSKSNLYSSAAANVIVGLSEDANKGPSNLTGRTFVGIDDENGDGEYETIQIFNSESSTQTNAAKVLRSFGAEKIIMLDGGGSTQLICRGIPQVTSGRSVPQTVAVTGKASNLRIYSFTLDSAHPKWTRTGMIVASGVTLLFEASGNFYWDPLVPEPRVGPDGASWTPNQVSMPEQFLLRDSPIVSLIAMIGGKLFPIGSKRTVRVEVAGELLLGINERWIDGCWDDNRGRMQIRIQVSNKDQVTQ